MGCNCGGKTKNQSASPESEAMQGVLGKMTQQNFTDNQMEMVVYNHPNRGEHPVYGASTKTFYGNRKGGGSEKFLVHKSDIAAQPHLYQVSRDAMAPVSKIIEPPPPRPVEIPKRRVRVEPEEDVLPEEIPPPALGIAVKEIVDTPVDEVATRALNDAKFDLGVIPSVTPALARNLAEAGMVSAERILEAGAEGLVEVKGIGGKKAELIYAYVKDRFS